MQLINILDNPTFVEIAPIMRSWNIPRLLDALLDAFVDQNLALVNRNISSSPKVTPAVIVSQRI